MSKQPNKMSVKVNKFTQNEGDTRYIILLHNDGRPIKDVIVNGLGEAISVATNWADTFKWRHTFCG